ncbi:MAG: metallophosphoesterase family protein [Bacteroidota bacterium]
MNNKLRNRTWTLLLLLLLPTLVSAQVTRQPYLQEPTPTSVIIRWQSGTGVIGSVHYSTSASSLPTKIVESADEKIYHDVRLTDLAPSTKYYYSVDGSSKGTEEQYFVTPPPPGNGTPIRIWAISDFGQTSSRENARRLETVSQWKSFNNNSYHASFVLSMGDQTEDDAIYQLQHNFFDQLEQVLRSSPLYTIVGNHDGHDSLYNYERTFSVPTNAEAGGIASGTVKYYSFDYANVHVVSLCTEIHDDAGRKAQREWLKKDLDNNKQEWLIACMHQPFHSGGYHPSDEVEFGQSQRSDWLPVLEDHGVDLVLQGHNHVYERSYLLDNLIGMTTTLTEANKKNTGNGREDGDGPYLKKKGLPHQGTVFITVPSGGVSNPTKSFRHYQIFPFYFPGSDNEGSVVIDIHGDRMDVTFLCNEKNDKGSHVWDYFAIKKAE